MTVPEWIRGDGAEQILPPGAKPVVGATARLQAMLDERASAFAQARFGTRDGIELRAGRRGLVSDEAASFLRALDAGLLTLDEVGGVRLPGCRPKPGGGRYQLFAANRYGGDLYVSINLEYVIQFGAACELVAFYGWSPQDVEVELGEFDALGRGRSRVLLAMEAKARIEGPDSLSNLWHSLIGYASADVAPNPVDNHSRKYTELLRLTADGPVVLWLVAAQARWSVLATRVGSRIEFGQCPTVAYDDVVRSVERADAQPATRPSREHEAE